MHACVHTYIHTNYEDLGRWMWIPPHLGAALLPPLPIRTAIYESGMVWLFLWSLLNLCVWGKIGECFRI